MPKDEILKYRSGTLTLIVSGVRNTEVIGILFPSPPPKKGGWPGFCGMVRHQIRGWEPVHFQLFLVYTEFQLLRHPGRKPDTVTLTPRNDAAPGPSYGYPKPHISDTYFAQPSVSHWIETNEQMSHSSSVRGYQLRVLYPGRLGYG